MLLKSLYIKNFRQFKGETKVEFACDNEKNVTIILGDNTFGKTTLLQTFNWCLYNFVVFDKDSRPDFLLNHELAASMQFGSKENVEVQITLIHNNIEYTITRSQDYIWSEREVRGEKSKVSMCYKSLNSDGQTEIRDQYIDNAINEILPKNLSNYFFFDTERVRDISTRQDVSESVKGLLGLTALDNTIRHIGSKTAKTTVLGKLYSSMDNDGNKKATEALERINSTQARKIVIAEQLETLKTQIYDYEEEKERLDSILKDNQGTASMQSRVLSLERMIKTESDALESAYSKFLNDFNNGALTFFAKPLMDRAITFLVEAKVDDKGIKDMTDQSIYEILERKICICGTTLAEDSEAYLAVKDQLNYLPPESIGTSIRNFKEKIDSYNYANRNFFNNLKSR
jgi:DNA sulfur modification protein DndD